LRDLIRNGDVVAYMNDFLVAMETLEKHLEILDRVFRLLVENRLELRLRKCRFMYEKIEFLGYVISAEGVRPNDAGMAAIKEFPTSKCVRELPRIMLVFQKIHKRFFVNCR